MSVIAASAVFCNAVAPAFAFQIVEPGHIPNYVSPPAPRGGQVRQFAGGKALPKSEPNLTKSLLNNKVSLDPKFGTKDYKSWTKELKRSMTPRNRALTLIKVGEYELSKYDAENASDRFLEASKLLAIGADGRGLALYDLGMAQF